MPLPVLKYKVGDKVRIANNSRMRTLVGHIREIEAVFPLLAHGCPYRLQFCPNLFREDELELHVPPGELAVTRNTFETDSARDLPLGPVIVNVTQGTSLRQSFMDAIEE